MVFLGITVRGVAQLTVTPHAKIRVHMMPAVRTGWLQKAHYCAYVLWVAGWALLWRPKLIYASDPMSLPAASIANFFCRASVVYHEHDSPSRPTGVFSRAVGIFRQAFARRAFACVIPNSKRADSFLKETSAKAESTFVVFNCPGRVEITLPEKVAEFEAIGGDIWLLYHGSIVPERLPFSVIDALTLLPKNVRLRVVGYETAGDPGYTNRLVEHASNLGIGARVEIVGPLAREPLMEVARRSHIGLAILLTSTTDINLLHMVGASNKSFDYLASGCPLIVSDLPEWRSMFVDEGLAVACEPTSPASIAAAVQHILRQPNFFLSARSEGLRRVMVDWNYESQFAPVLNRIRSVLALGDGEPEP